MNNCTLIMPENNCFGISGVYKVTFNNQHFYIGGSKNLANRITFWKSYSKKGYGPFPNSNYKKIIKPITHLRIEILEICSEDDLDLIETSHIQKNCKNAFILNRGVKSKGGWKYTPEESAALSKALTVCVKEDYKPLNIVKTEGEWEVIFSRMKESGKTDLSVFIRSEIRKLSTEYSKCPKCVSPASGNKKTRRPYIPEEYYNKLEIISRQMKIPVSSVVDNLIILPLLQGKVSEQQQPIPQKQH